MLHLLCASPCSEQNLGYVQFSTAQIEPNAVNYKLTIRSVWDGGWWGCFPRRKGGGVTPSGPQPQLTAEAPAERFSLLHTPRVGGVKALQSGLVCRSAGRSVISENSGLFQLSSIDLIRESVEAYQLLPASFSKYRNVLPKLQHCMNMFGGLRFGLI
jgi:hypothetical protein